MAGGTTFHFVAGGIHPALEQAKDAAGHKDVRHGGRANTIGQYLQEGLIDEMHNVVSPILRGHDEPLFEGLDLDALGHTTAESLPSENALHVALYSALEASLLGRHDCRANALQAEGERPP